MDERLCVNGRPGIRFGFLPQLAVAVIFASALVHADPGAHWSFQKPERPPLPEISNRDWVRGEIDAFILARLEHEKLGPSGAADDFTLIRRLYLDLVGLPPSPEEVLAFVNDDGPEAYEELVDGLLASPHYGERQARHWLDAARYADTNGYEKDRARSIWPYRDWVIEAFNRDLPFDRFVIEQIAGDLLPGATVDQRIATGFHRNTMFNEEGGIDAAEDRFKRLVDRVNTTGTVFLGLTIGCAQCHDHKFDPISQREYYGFMAFFENVVETKLRLEDRAVREKREAIGRKIDRLEEFALWQGNRIDRIDRGFESWREGARAISKNWQVLEPAKMRSLNRATLSKLEDDSILATGDIPNDDVYELEFVSDLMNVRALRLEVLPHESLPGGGPGRGTILAEGDFLLTGIEVSVSPLGNVTGEETISFEGAAADFSADGRSAEQAYDGNSDTGWSIKGAMGVEHRAVFEFDRAVGWEEGTRFRVRLHQDYIHQHVLGRFRISVTTDEGPYKAAPWPDEVERMLAQPLSHTTRTQLKRLRQYYFLREAPALARERKQIAALRNSMPSFPTTLAFEEAKTSRITTVYHRGEFLSPTDPVTADVPAVLHALPEGRPLNRMTLAEWLVSDDNPLLARVTMNRLWQQLFGTGLVATADDFGTRGAAPSHPKLLDWLATEFVAHEWSLKAMMKEIVMSATYRQSSNVTAEFLKRDPDNVLLARGSRVRVEAEIVRDIALSVGGLLNNEIGGASVYPPQPEGVTTLSYGGPAWPTSTSRNDRYRRGMYTYWKRTAPFAMSMMFDAPTSEGACVRRRRTNTPLQALTLLNDVVFTDAAQAVARRVLNETEGGVQDRVRYLYLLCLSRYPDETEIDRIARFVASQQESLDGKGDAVASIAGLNASNPFMPDATRELAAWTLASRAVLNLDEMIVRE